MAGPAHGGALDGIRVVELAAIGPAPFAGMLLADFGADVVRIDRPGAEPPIPGARPSFVDRGRRSLALDLKSAQGLELLLRLVDTADVLTEGFRPGVAERLGVGPEVCLERNPGLVYARMTGWGQDGPYAQMAGHDLNYIALTGVLAALGEPGSPPPPPLNVVGDFGGGGMFLLLGILLALVERQRSGRGQVVDAAIFDGVTVLASSVHQLRAAGIWRDERSANIVDGGAPFYRAYGTLDGHHVCVAAVEHRFYAELLRGVGLDVADWPQWDRERWPALHRKLAEVFVSRTRDEWCALFEGTDACFAPVLDWHEAAAHPQARARTTFVEAGGLVQPTPAPRLGRTPGQVSGRLPVPGEHNGELLEELGFTREEIASLEQAGAVSSPQAQATAVNSMSRRSRP